MRALLAKTRVTAIAIGLGLVAIAALAPAASAASGRAVLELNGAAAKALRAGGVRIAPTGAAEGGPRQVRLPIRAGLVGSSTTVLRFGGGLFLGKGKQRLRLGGLRLTLGKRASLAGRLGGESLPLFRVLKGGQRELDPASGSVHLSGLRLRLRRPAAKEIAARLGLERRPLGTFGTLAATEAGLVPGNPAPAGTTPGTTTGCPLPGSAGPAPEQPLLKPIRPSAAVDVTGASVSWNVRDSFIRYINTGEGTSVFDGATPGPPEVRPGSSAALTYTFGFPFAEGWHDPGANPADPADDRAAIYFNGGVRFLYSAHGIDLRTSAPELEIDGGASRAIFMVAEGAEPPEREVIVNLDLSRAASVQTSGTTVTYEHVPGAIPAGTASSVFAGFYAPGTDFGCFSVSYSTAS